MQNFYHVNFLGYQILNISSDIYTKFLEENNLWLLCSIWICFEFEKLFSIESDIFDQFRDPL